MNLQQLIDRMIRDEQFLEVMNNPLAQFGPDPEPFLGATLLPEVRKDNNEYTEDAIRYRTVVANDGTRYSPVQLKGSVMSGSFRVQLGYSDIGSQLTGADYDALLRILRHSGRGDISFEAAQSLTRWADVTLNRPLLVKNEKMRWEAIVNAQVVRTGDDGYTETVSLSAPSGHRPAAGGAWSSNSYDPYPDIIAGMEFMAAKGYTINRMVARRPVVSKLSNNEKIRTRVGRISMASGTVTGLAGRASRAELNSLFSEDDLPPIELYDRQYRTQSGTAFYIPSDCLIMVATTGRDETLDLGDTEDLVIRDTLGYMAVGTPTGQSNPGRVSLITPYQNKPPRVEGEAWQASFPVITEPEAIFVITGIT